MTLNVSASLPQAARRWLAGLVAVLLMPAAHAFSVVHEGATDPALQGWLKYNFSESTWGPLEDDLGRPAWRVSNYYSDAIHTIYSGALTEPERALIAAAGGWRIAFTARVLQGGRAAVYTAELPQVLAVVGYDDSHTQHGIAIGLDASNDTVVVLPTSASKTGPRGTMLMQGPSIRLAGNGYHDYVLTYSTATGLASLTVDGQPVLSSFAGLAGGSYDLAAEFQTMSGGQAHWAHVHFAPVPEPAAPALMLVGLAAVVVAAGRRSAPRLSGRP